MPEGYSAEPWYPTPVAGWDDAWTESYEKAAKLVKQMTLAEKTNVSTGTGQFMGRLAGRSTSTVAC